MAAYGATRVGSDARAGTAWELRALLAGKASTPLHFLSSRTKRIRHDRVILCFRVPRRSPWPIDILLKANPAALYQPDKRGMFPIHVAASVGAHGTITRFIGYCPSSAGLRDSRGRTFLHIAAEKEGWKIVTFACRTPSLAWILNMQDTDGNTALHVTVQTGCLRSFCSLLGNPRVHLNLTNKKGQTPLHISQFNIPPGIFYQQSTPVIIGTALDICGARSGRCRWDHFKETYTKEKGHGYHRQEVEKLKDSTQTLCIGSVLIATMAFGATFALPGGYRADDHTNEGTPTLAGRYSFDAFMIANALAFICSSVATIGLMFSGLPMVDLKSRGGYFMASSYLVSTSVTSLTAAFDLGVYMVLAPVAHKTAVAISVMSPFVVICTRMEMYLKWAELVRPLCRRIGLTMVLMTIPNAITAGLLLSCWPILVIFGWPAIARNH
ncbi:hypothetical protein EJB05_01149, partial [Eragrostis curvula]